MFVCGSGVGASIAACKLAGIRAAICHDVYSAHQGVEHDDMNVLCLGSEIVGPSLARDLVTTFLAARFDGGERYVKRLKQIEDLKGRCPMPESNLHKLSALGQSVWIDYLSRQMLQSGKLAKMMEEDAVVGVTSNPTIFQKAISEGNAYDEQLKEILDSGEEDPKEIFLQLTSRDISDACDLLRKVWDEGKGSTATSHGRSTRTSPTTVTARSPRLAGSTTGSTRPNLYVKIPATEPGLGAIEEMIAAGKSINVTLIFSLDRHQEVMEAYIRGLERLVESGGDPSQAHPVASFFVSRVQTEADKRLDEIGGDAVELKGKLGDRERKAGLPELPRDLPGRALGGPRGEGRVETALPLGVHVDEEPGLPRRYVRRGAANDTVNTMPEETIRAFQDHGEVEVRNKDATERRS